MEPSSLASDSGARPVVALGITGSIAAYKAADLTSKLAQADVDVHVLMTASAMKLVQPRTFLTLSRNPVITDLWEVSAWRPGHIALAERASVLIIAPATANILGKMANGLADDALSTYCLSHSGAVVVAPAMNPRMWNHPAVQANVETLLARGVRFVGPDSGRVACGADGAGRMAPVDDILAVVNEILGLGHVK
ncbi:MAG: phosphopantothenoylcysteine decarboxylase [Lentisphaeria bacterium]|nr:phosphopantothenoylcysteine decarboxylase [Lentisphaeria bacterium]